MRSALPLLALIAVLAVPPPAWARNTLLDLPVEEAKKSGHSSRLLDVPFYMAGQKHPPIAKSLGEFSSNRRTNAFNKSDRSACQIAFLSAIIALQQRARAEGGNAVVEIRSITRHEDLSSPSQYRCAAGNVVANVVLTGRVVKLKGR
ncbi:MAG: excinuclease ABC subunit A [Deltaproteobacteria bacterium]|nr:excinuclease ABC subunit A [Deltaproteobacteria bacterium]